MKKIFTLIITLFLVSCSDGDFEVPAFEFAETINSCNDYFLYKTSTSKTEVLFTSLSNTQLASKVGEKTFSISSSLAVTYRIFNDGIDNDYFCQTVPPTTPTVLKELEAQSGTIVITTSEILDGNNVVTGYIYDISFKNLLFMDESERIYFETLDFGTFTIKN
jgi:hypothetical protein